MCQIFLSADPQLYAHRARSLRLHGVATSVRLENLFWQVLDEIAERDGYTVPQLCTKLYDELVAERGAVDNFASFLRVCCTRYLALQLAGDIPQDRGIALRELRPLAPPLGGRPPNGRVPAVPWTAHGGTQESLYTPRKHARPTPPG